MIAIVQVKTLTLNGVTAKKIALDGVTPFAAKVGDLFLVETKFGAIQELLDAGVLSILT